jgi:hypothetical protein
MRSTTPLKLCAIAFTVLWTGWMLWWSESYAPVNAIMMAICGLIVGYAWYRVMRWQFRRSGLLRPDSGAAVDGRRGLKEYLRK